MAPPSVGAPLETTRIHGWNREERVITLIKRIKDEIIIREV